ncbi:hypothetical protein L3X38_025926 [Prunus dulcis]|uniref:Uncharacterized protein n=1 Tax=Prunus dulcis TaxID=3755 RepID=A0AAD4W5D3_PRUDU|nr:hypothetical protein L3X38_025926 [Prunus dulcis]
MSYHYCSVWQKGSKHAWFQLHSKMGQGKIGGSVKPALRSAHHSVIAEEDDSFFKLINHYRELNRTSQKPSSGFFEDRSLQRFIISEFSCNQ